MPTYEYECKSCGHRFDAFQRMSDAPLTGCPQCGRAVRRLINGGSGIIFKGSGFYVTDKKSGGGNASSSVKPAAEAAQPAQTTPQASADAGGSSGKADPGKQSGENSGGLEKKIAG
ncbi:MAG: zinc ribbon domain-containing protein [Treponema sp.]|jgi:putative FmdB family regulatory protein|nr:zinc ribbon domain-containing protein [Treponema sp.]